MFSRTLYCINRLLGSWAIRRSLSTLSDLGLSCESCENYELSGSDIDLSNFHLIMIIIERLGFCLVAGEIPTFRISASRAHHFVLSKVFLFVGFSFVCVLATLDSVLSVHPFLPFFSIYLVEYIQIMATDVPSAEAALPGNGVAAKEDAPRGASSALFTPLTIGNGKITLSHRIVLAPLTRNRGVPLNPNPTPESPNRIWYPDSLVKEYYLQRTTPGGLLITEGLPPSIEGNGMPGVPGIFCEEQKKGWKEIVEAVHAKGGYIYAQLWNSGRASIPHHTGLPTVSSSATPYEGDEVYSHPPPGTSTSVKYSDFPPTELSVEGIKKQIADYVASAKMAVEECGFDGVEVHGGNGYLPEQFLASNINKRTDDYGGSPEKRCRFVLELMDALARAVGDDRLAIRLSPFGLFNQNRSDQRLETWGHLCRELKRKHSLSYVHFIEPRYEQLHSLEVKNKCK